MNLVGKIFVLLIAIMSIVFSTFAIMVYATHRNWRQLVESQDAGKPGFRKRLSESDTKIRELNDKLDTLEAASKASEQKHIQEVNAVKSKSGILEQQLATLTIQRDGLLKTARESAAAVAAMEEAQAARRETLGVLRAEREHALKVTGQHFDKLFKLETEVNQGTAEIDRLKVFNRDLAGQIVKLQEVLAYHGMSEHTPMNRESPPRVEGLILAMSEGGELVTISIGSDDGILRNHQLEVFRLGTTPKYLGRIQVIESQPDRAVAKVIPETRKGPFEKFDHVATKLQ